MLCTRDFFGKLSASLSSLPCYHARRKIGCRALITRPRNIQIKKWSQSLSTAPHRWTSPLPLQRRKDILPTVDTIYALSTAPGRAAIAIIRVSGPACLDIYGGLCPDKSFPHPRHATLRRLRDPRDASRILDGGALVLYFPATQTVTGEDVLELHVHGGPAIVQAVLEAIPHCTESRPRRRTAEYSQIRAADPGEFTKRAFYNGRLDLAQAEALGETLAAETEQQRRLAVAGATNGLSARYEEWRKMLLYARGELEALIDFSEDQHFDESPAEFMKSVRMQITDLTRKLRLHIKNATRGELLRSGIGVALLGAPNAGKSSLLNRIIGREAAIVSSEAGTTRDIVDVNVDIGGWLVRLGDMAGLRRNVDGQSGVIPTETSKRIGEVEQEGIRRARERAIQSDVVIVIVSVARTRASGIHLVVNQELLDAVSECHEAGKPILFVVNKVDLVSADDRKGEEKLIHQSLVKIFPAANASNTFLLSCYNASLNHGPPTSDHTDPDPGGIQKFVDGLTSSFLAMTSPLIGIEGHQTTTAEARSYWNASLSITHRQSVYLQRCLISLEEFLTANTSPAMDGGSCGEPSNTGTHLTHHIDGHDDLVGENMSHDPRAVACRPGRSSGHTSTYLETVGNIATSDKAEFDVVTAAEHLRYAADYLAKLTGRGEAGDVEDVLGVVFEK